MDENNNRHDYDREHHELHHVLGWVKVLLISFAAFLGAYLATYYIVDQARHTHGYPFARFERPNKDFMAQRRLYEDFNRFERDALMMDKELMAKNPVKIKPLKDNEGYKICINLKPFDDNEKNIKVDIKPNRVNISGQSDKVDKNNESEFSFAQSFILPETINVSKVKKERKGHKYIIILPFED